MNHATEIINWGQLLELNGESGRLYSGRIYEKDNHSSFTGPAIVCLTNSYVADHAWKHKMNSIFYTGDAQQAMAEFKNRDDLSHIVLLPQDAYAVKKPDVIDDLIRCYLHG